MNCMKMKRFFTVSTAALGVALAAVWIWTIYDSLTGGRSRWYYPIPASISYASLCYHGFKEEKSKK